MTESGSGSGSRSRSEGGSGSEAGSGSRSEGGSGSEAGSGSRSEGGSGSEAVRAVLARAVHAGEIPGAVFAAGLPGLPAEVVVVGEAQVQGGRSRDMHRDTLFDLASLTKVVATLPAVLRLAELGELALDDRVVRFLPGFQGDGRACVTVRQLLAHTAGLPAGIPFWSRYTDPDEANRAMLSVSLDQPPGVRVVYSDIGFMLLGRVVAAITGAALDVSVAELVTRPLGMARTCFRPGGGQGLRAAATELQPGGAALVGVVHDENARFFGGVAGHAGLFAPADDLARYLTGAWLGEELLSPATRRAACQLQTEGRSGSRGLGWVLRGDPADPLGTRWPSSSICHTGFTGTSLACDPASGYWAVLLTNEVHFGRGRGIIRRLRESVHDCCAPPRS